MALPPGFLDELRARVPISEIVGRRVSWDSRKSNPGRGDFWACCPFHEERSPSFHVDDRRGFYKCFGCGASGDAIGFLRERENLSFMEAVAELARAAGMEVPAPSPEAAARADRASVLVGCMEAAAAFYAMQLRGARAQDARGYLAGRGLTEATVADFALGYAPAERGALHDHLTARGADTATLVEAGLVRVPEEGGPPRDRFRDRIMFPIRDRRGRCIGFGARALRPGQEPKYLNSPETPLFDKSRTLYNHAMAREASGRSGALVVVEGYMDVIALAQAGLRHAVAPLGTAITEAQLQAMWALSPEPVIALDGDAAGMKAAQRVLDLALPLIGPGRSLRFALLPAGQDPDDIARSGGAAAVERLVAGAEPLVEMLWRRETAARSFDSPERRAALDAALRSALARIPDEGLRAHYRAALAERRASLFRPARPALAGGQRGRRSFAEPGPLPQTRASALASDVSPPARARGREAAILLTVLRHPVLLEQHADTLAAMEFANPDLDGLRIALLSALLDHDDTPVEGDALCDALRQATGLADPVAHLEAAPQVAALRFARAGAPGAEAAIGLVEALARHGMEAALEREVAEASHALNEPAAPPALADRISAAAMLAARQRLGPPVTDGADETDPAEALRNAIADQIWVKRKRRWTPNR